MPGTDAALTMAMGHVILREFFVDRQVPYFTGYVTRFTDAPFLVTLQQAGDTARPGKFLTVDALGDAGEHAAFKPVVLDNATQQAVAPGGSLGFRFGDQGLGRWNLELGDIEPMLTLHGEASGTVTVDLPRFDAAGGSAGLIRRGVPARRIAGQLVTTVFDLLLAQYGVGREGCPASGRRPPPRCSPTWCCPQRRGTRSTTCPAPTCTRSSTRSTRRSRRPGRPAATSTPSTPWPGRSRSWRRRIWASGGTWSRSRCSTTRRMRWRRRMASSATGGQRAGRRCRAPTFPSWLWSSATTRMSPRRWPPWAR